MHTALGRCGLVLAALAASVSLACKPSEPRTDAEKLARGREIIERMSAKLASLQTFAVDESWRIAAGPGAVIGVGTMLVRPPAAAVTVVHGGSSYWYSAGAYYTRVISGGAPMYQVVRPPAGIVIATLPAGCSSVRVGGVAYSQCGGTYYQRVSGGYRVVVL